MEMNEDTVNEFARLLLMRGLGLYGDQKMTKICEESGLKCTSDGSFEKIQQEEISKTIEKLIVNYAKFNLPAKMTVLVLARKYNISIPEELKKTEKRKSKYRQRIS